VTAAAGQELEQRLADAVASLRAAGAQVIVLPETTLRAQSGELEATSTRLAATLDPGSVLVVGMDRVDAGGEDNAALALGAGGRLLASYSKRHLLPPFERRYRPGTQPAIVRVGSLPAGLAICKDLDFPSLGRDNAREGAAIVLAPAWDFGVDGWLHSRMALLRGVESGFALARAARRGRLTISDTRGRVLAEARSDASRTTTLLATVPVGPVRTVYSRLGDWLGWLSVVLLAVAVARSFRFGPAPKRAPAGRRVRPWTGE
jgi:apolipoprotein N-acyltransferase